MAMYVVTVIAVIFLALFTWMKKKYSVWSNRGVKGPTPLPIVGNFGKIMRLKEGTDDFVRRLYNEYPNEKVVGAYRGFTPVLVVRDPEHIKQVLIKDFNVFQDRGMKTVETPFNTNIFFTEDESWRILRQKLTPIFTTGKLKSMFPLVAKSADDFIKYVDGLVQNNIDHEIRKLIAKYTLEVIGSSAFGVEMNAFGESKNVFRVIADQMSTSSPEFRVIQSLEFIFPGFENFLLKYTSHNSDQLMPFFSSLVDKIVQEREGQPKIRKDFMDLMIELKEQGKVERKENKAVSTLDINSELIAAQALIFFVAGFDTSSSTSSFMLHELAWNQDIQDRLYEEISEVFDKHGGNITYEDLNELTYLEMVLDETLRKYPVLGHLQRKANADYVFPETKLKVDKGTIVLIPVCGLQSDPQYYENPDVFDPERFSPANKANIPACTYMPFGEGPRHCIGLRFAKVQSMYGMAMLLKSFKVEPSEKSKQKLTFDPIAFTLSSDKGIWLKISRR